MIKSNCEMAKLALFPFCAENFEKYYVKPIGDPALLEHSVRMRRMRNMLYTSSTLLVASLTTAIFCYKDLRSNASKDVATAFYYLAAISTALSAVFILATVPMLHSRARAVQQRANTAELARLEIQAMRIAPHELIPQDPPL